MRQKLKSRKFLATVAGVITVIANEGFDLGLDRESVFAIVTLIVSYVVGEGYVDGKKVEKNA